LFLAAKKAADHRGVLAQHGCRTARKFMAPAGDVPPNSPLANIAYAYHFDAGLYAQYLRRYAEARGVKRIEGRVVEVKLRSENGFIEGVALESGRKAPR